jgi:DmsE family decaheme c-type cytochrome
MIRVRYLMILVFAIVLLVSMVSFLCFGQNKGTAEKEGYIGSETCQGCHGELYEAFKKNPHWGKECESCHGPGEKHAEAEGKGLIVSFKEKNAAARSDVCLTCHEKLKTFYQFRRSVHKLSAVGCGDCHQMHGTRVNGSFLKKYETRVTAPLLKTNEIDLCLSCHQDVKSSFYLPNSHKVMEGALTCSDCHAPHGSRERASVRQTSIYGKQETCFNCHPEKRGPWVFEHLAQKKEGCSICHAPHGSPNRFMLIRRDSRQLCAECHGLRHYVTNNCVNCHNQIHGSNFSSRFMQ